MIMIGIKCKLQEQPHYKSFLKMYQTDVCASICRNFNSYLTVMSSITCLTCNPILGLTLPYI